MPASTSSFVSKYAIVTGAGSGIGKACAHVLAEAGACVGLVDRSRDNLEETCRTLSGQDRGHAVAVADVKNATALELALGQLTAAWPGLDILVVNAGINGVWAPLERLRPEEWEETLHTNLTGTFLTVKAALPRLRTPGASIVIVSSINGSRIFNSPGATAYACSKAGQIAFTKMAALELAPRGIRVNAVCPGSIDTAIDESTIKRGTENLLPKVEYPEGGVPLTHGLSGSARQVANVVAFLVSASSSHLTGSEIFVDGAQSLL